MFVFLFHSTQQVTNILIKILGMPPSTADRLLSSREKPHCRAFFFKMLNVVQIINKKNKSSVLPERALQQRSAGKVKTSTRSQQTAVRGGRQTFVDSCSNGAGNDVNTSLILLGFFYENRLKKIIHF